VSDFSIRCETPADADATLEVFRRAVHVTAAGQYSREQLRAWAPPELDPARWAELRGAVRGWVAEMDARVVGFMDLDRPDHLGMLYVDPCAGFHAVQDQTVERRGVWLDNTQMSLAL
jgi:putative acetyltransferase